nr:protein adenylyltransferase SelO family protein [Pirellula sp.]
MSDQSISNPVGWNLEATYAALPPPFFSAVLPTQVARPEVIILNEDLGNELGLNLRALSRDDAAALFSGNKLPHGAVSIAQAYAGHQFGGFTMLGDGRAILIGEQRSPDGKLYDIQLKGSGPTKYSRRGDGRAAVGPMLREYIISEAMHFLGISTTRSLAVVSTGEPVYRDEALPGGVITRFASSHIRVGTFQYFAAIRDNAGLQTLADYTINRHYPDLISSEDRYIDLLKTVIDRQA